MGDLPYFLRLLAGRRGKLALGALLALITLAAGTALLALSGWFIAAAAIAGLSAATAAGFNFFAPAAGVRFFAIVRIAARYGERLVSHDATLSVLADLRTWFFRKAIPLAPARLGGLSGGEILSHVTSDIEALDNLYLRGLGPLGTALLLTLGAAVFVGLHHGGLALTLLLAMAITGFLLPWLAARLGTAPGRSIAEAQGRLRTRALDAIRGARDLLAYNAAQQALAHMAAVDGHLRSAQYRLADVGGRIAALTVLAAGGSILALLWVGLGAAEAGEIAVPVVAMVALLTIGLFEAMAPLVRAFQFLGHSRAAAQRLRSLAETAPAVVDPPCPAPLPRGSDIRFEDVGFSYTAGAPPILKGLDLSVAPGERVAIIGESGSGKSTLAHLLLRFWDVSSGTIRLAGHDLRAVAQAEIHRRIAFLSQDTHLFAASVRENLLLARPQAEESALWTALEGARLAATVAALPDGLDTPVGEVGHSLSGGQARRLVLARALLQEAEILLLDEPTEGLDRETELAFFHDLERLLAGRTVLLITHAALPLGTFNRVLRLDGGRLSDAGSID